MAASTPTAQSSLHPFPHVDELADHVQALAHRLRGDMEEHQHRQALATIWEMERTLTALEYELLDGEQCAEGDAC
jgi:hypothetical protein